MIFKDRAEAGKKLSQKLGKYKNKDAVVISLARGGVPVGYEIAKYLHIPLEVLIARKLGYPNNPEYGIGAISEKGSLVLDYDAIGSLGISQSELKDIVFQEKLELERRAKLYRKGKSLVVKGKTVILVDDGVATGLTLEAAVESLIKSKAKAIVIAIPVCSLEAAVKIQSDLGSQIEEFICLEIPKNLKAISAWYREFGQVSDEEVEKLLS